MATSVPSINPEGHQERARDVNYLDALREGVVVVGPDLRINYVNARYYKQFDLTEADIHPGARLRDVYTRLAERDLLGDLPGLTIEEAVDRSMATWGDKIGGVERRFLSDGRVIDIYRTLTVHDDILSVHADVTSAVHSEQEAERNRQYMASLLENTTDGISLLDEHGRFLMFNDRMLELYDIDKDSVHWGIHYEDFLRQMGDLKALSEADCALAIEDRRRFAYDPDALTIRRRLRNGRTLHISKTVLAAGGNVMTFRDMTEDLRREEELTRARLIAEQSSRSKSGFVARMSHEMRTPLNGILGVSALLGVTEMEPRQRELVNVISASGKVLLRLIDDILDLSRIDAETFSLVEQAFDMSELIHSCIDIVMPSATEKNLEFRRDTIRCPDRAVVGDMVRIKQILFNLLTNAIKFTEAGHVELTLKTEDLGDCAALEFQVSDSGVGIDPEKYAQIFERFYQIDGTITRRHGGAGLGLAITRKLVETMGGSIDVASAPVQGTSFSVRLTLDYADAGDT